MNHYQTLGIEKDATDDQIKSAYRKLAKKHHPDVNDGDKSSEERFNKVNEAYEVLSDPASRLAYDRSQLLGSRSRGFGGFGDYTIFNVDFDTMFGPKHGGKKTEDHVILNVSVDFYKLLGDHVLTADMDQFDDCDKCHYLGPDSKCSKCHGAGKIKSTVSIKVPVNLCKRRYTYNVEGDLFKLMLKIPNRTGDGRDVLMRVTAKMPDGVTLSGSNILHKVNIGLRDAVLGPDPAFTAIDGSKFKIKLSSAIKKDFSDIYIKIPERGMMGDGRRGTYVFDVRVSFPNISALNKSELDDLRVLLDKL